MSMLISQTETALNPTQRSFCLRWTLVNSESHWLLKMLKISGKWELKPKPSAYTIPSKAQGMLWEDRMT